MKAIAATITATAVLSFGIGAPVSAEPDTKPELQKVTPSQVSQALEDAETYLGSQSNVVLVVTDDQPKGTTDAMPNLQSMIRDKGVQINNGIAPTALCCPARTALLTGDHSHTTDVWDNNAPHGAWPTFNANGFETNNLATHLNGLGYDTGLFGKYLNGFVEHRPAGYIPPGWDSFAALHSDTGDDGDYYNYRLIGQGNTIHYGSAPRDYSIDVTNNHAVNFVANAPAEQPLFLYWAPFGPHAPIIPAPRDQGTWPLEPASAIGALNERDMSDKPRWMRSLPRLDGMTMRQKLTHQHETLMSVDDGIGDIANALRTTGRLSNTLFVYVSDNGLMLGAHRLGSKNLPHKRASAVPMFMRWDGHIRANSSSSRITPNVDLTATIAEATGAKGWAMDGKSFLSTTRDGVVLEGSRDATHEAYCGYRTARYMYVEWTEGFGRELYDYQNDPNELDNRIRDNGSAITQVRADMRNRAQANCNPEPPGFSWN